jgi:YtkA-like
MRARWIMAFVAVGMLALPASAHAGGWATVELSSTPAGLGPNEPWNVEMTILQHGRTPLEGIHPKVIVKPGAGGDTRTINASPTGEPGVYRAQVEFAEAGQWEYVVDDGFTQRHTYPPVQIGSSDDTAAAPASSSDDTAAGPASSGDDGPPLWAAFLAAIAAGLAAAGLTSLFQRRRRADSVAPSAS